MKFEVIAISQAEGYKIGEKIGEKDLQFQEAQEYFNRIKLNHNKPSTRILRPVGDYALDNAWRLVKGGNHNLNSMGKLVMKEIKEKSVSTNKK